MGESEELDWVEEADSALSFVPDPDHRAHLLFRFEGKYLPAIRGAQTQAELARAWSSFHYYMTVRATNRKPFALTADEADRACEILTGLLHLPTSNA